MLTRRLLVCLDVRGDRVVKGVAFQNLRDVGNPVELAERYESEGADEIVFLDVSATSEERGTLMDIARQTAERLFIPLTIGGGVRSADDVARVLRAGADRVSINSAALKRPGLLRECADRFGAQAIVASIDAKLGPTGWKAYTHGGRVETAVDVIEWAEECGELGAGEILLTSIDRDGKRDGYDIELTAAVASRVGVPVVASGGAGAASHVVSVLSQGGADAALVAGILHDGVTTVGEIKDEMRRSGIPVRGVTNV
jgi:cyclase